MFKENKDFWLYLVGIIIMFVFIFYGTRSYMEENGIKISDANLMGDFSIANDTSSDVKIELINDEKQGVETDSPFDTNRDYYAVIDTNKGHITVELFEKNAPNTVANFISLSTKDFYNDTKFHRLIKDVLLQGGSNNTLDTNITNDRFGDAGYIIDDEINWDSLDYSQSLKDELTSQGYSSAYRISSKDVVKYRLAMASSAPNQNSSQFFIILEDIQAPSVEALRGKHTVFGEVIDNTKLIDTFNKYDTASPDFHLVEDIIIEDIRVYIRN